MHNINYFTAAGKIYCHRYCFAATIVGVYNQVWGVPSRESSIVRNTTEVFP